MKSKALPVILIIYSFFLIAVLVFIVKTENRYVEEVQVSNTPSVMQSPSLKPTPTPYSKYPLHRNIVATVFWVGEEKSEDNDFIANDVSAWDMDWEENYGGVDDPEDRKGYYPAEFIPDENPFYIALPYSDFTTRRQKTNINKVYWFEPPVNPKQSIIKNHWVRIVSGGNECFAQWENVGPNEDDDIEYVFGSVPPKNTFGAKAGIDISPAVRDCLKVAGVSQVDWQFVDDEDVPQGPWKEIVTTSGTNWN